MATAGAGVSPGMKVVHLNTFDTGGAATAAYRIHKGVQAAGIDSTLLVLRKTLADDSVKPLVACAQGADLVKRFFDRCNTLALKYPQRPQGLELFSDARAEVSAAASDEIRQADIVHLHWVAGLLDFGDWPVTLRDKPLVWTLHDMNPFTGGCHYAGNCTKYRQRCGACPQLGSQSVTDAARRAWDQKAAVYAHANIRLAAPSRWLGRCIAQSELMARFAAEVVPYGLPLDVFKPLPGEAIRRRLKIASDKRIILFGADAIANPRKGLRYLFAALERLVDQSRDLPLVLMVFGQGAGLQQAKLSFKVVPTGWIADPHLLAEVYAAADLFVLPSVEDNLPNTAIEALACGTPVVGFDAGGISDIITHEQTGFLARTGDTAHLAQGIAWVLGQVDQGTPFAQRCRAEAENRFSPQSQARHYIDIYRKMGGALHAGFRKHGQNRATRGMAPYLQEAEQVIDRELLRVKGENPVHLPSPPQPITRDRIERCLEAAAIAVDPVIEIEKGAHCFVGGPAADTAPVLSAIVSTYNSERFMHGCLEDLLAQSISGRMEIIVIDSASDQNEGEIVKAFQQRCDRIRYVRTAQRESVYAAWNRGIKMAQGRYVTNANTDDRHRRDAFERMTAVLDSAPQIALVYADVIKTATENQTFLNCTPTGILSWYDWQRERLLDRGCFIGPQPVWRRKMHEIYGYFDESLAITADYEFWLRISQSHDFQRISQPLGLYLERDDSVGHADRRRKQAEEQAVIAKYSKALAHGEMIGFEPFARLRRSLVAGDSGALRQAMQEITGVAHNGALAHNPLPIERTCRDFSALAGQGTMSSQQIEAFMQQVGFYFLTRGNSAASVAAKKEPATLPCIPSDSASAKAARSLPRQGGSTMQFYEKVQNGVHCLFDGGHPEVAQWVLEKLLAEEPGNALAHHECAVLAHHQGDAHNAAIHFERAAQLAPDNAAFQKSLGDFYHVVQGNIEKAVAQYRKALDLSPDDLGTVLTVAHLCVALHRFDEARGFYQRVLDIDPMHAEARRIMDQLIQQQRQQIQRQPSADELYESAKQFLGRSDSAQALQTLEQLLAISPTHALAHNDLGVLYYEGGDKEKALRHYEKAAELAPENLVFLKNLADFCFLEMDDAQKALTRYVQALTINPLDVESLMNTGHICTVLNLPEDARVFFNRVLEIEPWHMEAFKSLEKIDRPVCCKHAPAAAGDLYEQAQAAASAGDISGAIKLLQQLIGLQPQHAMAFNDLGVLFYDQGDKENALRHYEQAARLSPENETILKNMADFYYIEQGRTQEALQIYVRLLETNREDLDCLMAAGRICTDLGNQEDAVIFYTRVLEIAPENLQAREALSRFSVQSENDPAGATFSAPRRMAF